MAQTTEVVIIGAGPYGLSLAAHLRKRGVRYRIFGEAMRFWRNMPEGVNLKSFAFATNIAVPTRGYSFPQWCLQHGLEDFEPCTMQSFAAYGCEMQTRFVPDLEEVLVTNVAMRGRQFVLDRSPHSERAAIKPLRGFRIVSADDRMTDTAGVGREPSEHPAPRVKRHRGFHVWTVKDLD